MDLLEKFAAEGIANGWDVSWYFKEEWDLCQLWVIYWALLDNVSLELWAKKCYTGNQMYELRRGVKYGLAVSQYLDPNLSAKEMELICNRLLKEKKNEPT